MVMAENSYRSFYYPVYIVFFTYYIEEIQTVSLSVAFFENIDNFRKVKEHRSDLPLVSIALVIDEFGFPLDYEIYSGCSSEFNTMKQSIDNLKNRYGIKDAVIVADRGLNSVANLKMLQDMKFGFLVAQKISNLSSEYRKYLKSPEGMTSEDYDEWETTEGLNIPKVQ